MTTNRSTEELAMRNVVETWGRDRWPGCRVVHELVTGQRRIDIAFVQPDHIAGVEIKSGMDVLDRLDEQVKEFRRHIPEVWVAVAPKWVDHLLGVFGVGRLVAAFDRISLDWHDSDGKIVMYPHPAKRHESLTVPMLELLWRSELHAIAARAGLWSSKGKPARPALIAIIARKLTGDQIVSGVCRELRARNAFWKADPPIVLDGVSASDVAGRMDLFRSAAPAPPASP